MISLDPTLLDTAPLGLLDGEGVILGSYNPMDFAVRLNPRIHQLLQRPFFSQPDQDTSFEQLEAFSTYLHETIHWWQHIGSNFGLMASLRFPAQTHRTIRDLRQVAQTNGYSKSIELLHEHCDASIAGSSELNRILNYWHDLEAVGQYHLTRIHLPFFWRPHSFPPLDTHFIFYTLPAFMPSPAPSIAICNFFRKQTNGQRPLKLCNQTESHGMILSQLKFAFPPSERRRFSKDKPGSRNCSTFILPPRVSSPLKTANVMACFPGFTVRLFLPS